MTQPAALRPHIVVTGMMGVGKSSLGDALSAALDLPHRDSDGDIERLFGATGREMVTEAGVDALHDVEVGVLLGALASETSAVVTAAGWTIESAVCRRALAHRAFVVHLVAGVDELSARMATGAHRRPMSDAELAELLDRRTPLFTATADAVIDASFTVDEVAARALSEIAAAGWRRA